MTDREQIRRAAEMVVYGSDEGDIQYLAAYCLALLAELEELERVFAITTTEE